MRPQPQAVEPPVTFRGPEDVVLWAREHRVGWRTGVFVLHLFADGRCDCGSRVAETTEDLDADFYAVRLGMCDCWPQAAVALACRPGEGTEPTWLDEHVFGCMCQSLDEMGVHLHDLLVLDEHRWRSLAEPVSGIWPRPESYLR